MILFRCSAASLIALLVASPPQRRPWSWHESVDLYLEGKFERAVEPLVPLDARDYEEKGLAKKTFVLGSLKPFQRSRLKAVLAIDAEVTIARGVIVVCAGERETSPGVPHGVTWFAKTYVLALLEDPSRGPVDYAFLTSWYRLVTAYDQGRGDLASARLCIDTAPSEVKRDPEILLAYGAILETAAALQIEEEVSESAWQPDVQRAEQAYREALGAAPDLLEAQARLGRVLTLLGRQKEALDVLEPLRDAGDARIAYLARMFAGLAHQRLGAYTDARQEFAAAETVIPGLPSPPVATALAAYLHDDRNGARRLILGLARTPATAAVDPWAWYTKGTASRTAAYLNAVRLAAIR